MKIFLTACLLGLAPLAYCQQIPNWQLKDLQTDSLFGISADKAYGLLKDKTGVPVTVAVIDSGVDTLHVDLQSVLWVNPKKKKNDNGTYGWSYIDKIRYANLELTRQVRQSGDTSHLKPILMKQRAEAQQNLQNYSNLLQAINALALQLGKPEPRLADIKAVQPQSQVTQVLINNLSQKDDFKAFQKALAEGIAYFKVLVDYHLNTAYDPHGAPGPDVMGPDAHHGTHVAGIIAAVRHNGIGLDGIADNVKILAVRAVPDGDERDEDVASAIRYAADHGARVINMSFGKEYSQDKPAVDKAVAYALKKDVLLVQAAGNSNKNIDSTANFPRRVLADEAYIVVGASGLKGEKADFSNYGKTSVDVFAPGVQIYSSVPGSKYDFYDGTSMACPVVAGLAALVREYYPKLNALQVKEIILKSVVKRAALDTYCLTGGVVNAYSALQLAATYQ